MSTPPADAPPPGDSPVEEPGEERGSDDLDEVDEASDESFPASDAPASWAGPAGG